ncbi:hypothetical protein HK405_012172, partial [Cladochytrium tenue]
MADPPRGLRRRWCPDDDDDDDAGFAALPGGGGDPYRHPEDPYSATHPVLLPALPSQRAAKRARLL